MHVRIITRFQDTRFFPSRGRFRIRKDPDSFFSKISIFAVKNRSRDIQE